MVEVDVGVDVGVEVEVGVVVEVEVEVGVEVWVGLIPGSIPGDGENVEQNWTPWTKFIGKRVVVYTTTYHFLGTVKEVYVDGLGISYADFTDAKQIHDEKTPWQFDVSLLLGECRTPVTALAGFGIRQLPDTGVVENLV